MQSHKRPTVIQDTIIDYLRDRIIDGRLAPGDKLPARLEIEKKFQTSSVTVQRAFDRLIEYGFVVTRMRQGSFVAARPPHLSRYALAFPGMIDDASWVRYWTVLMDVARRRQRESTVTVVPYTGVDAGREDGEYPALVEDVRQKRLAGVIFATSPFLVDGTPLLSEQRLPRVAIMPPSKRRELVTVTLDGRSFFRRAVEYLASCQRRRIGLITVPGIDGERLGYFRSLLKSRDMTCLPHWVQTAHQSEPKWATNLARLLLSGGEGDTPDGLIITDDNLAEHACLGIVESGRRVQEDLDVVAHCNFPAPAPRMVPVQRLGYDIRRVLDACIGLVDRMRRGKRRPDPVKIEAVFESELDARSEPAGHAAAGGMS